MKISPARKAAFEILARVENENAYTSILLPLYEERLSEKDRSLCHQITLGVLRNRIFLDEIIKIFTGKEISKFDPEVVNALRIGLYQLKFLDKIPPYSAINESVNLVKYARKRSASGLVNAVLRKFAKKDLKFSFENNTERVSVMTSHPLWLVEKWTAQFGFEEAEKIARANNQPPLRSFRFTCRFFSESSSERERIKKLIKDEKGISESGYSDNSFNSRSFGNLLRDLKAKNFIYFQDEASQMVAHSVSLEAGQNFLDLCASPGSKTTLIAANLINNGVTADLFAGDFYKHRMISLKKNCLDQKVQNINFIAYDAGFELPFENESFDKILIDAPCSGTGTIRQKPEIRYSLKPTDFKNLQNKQLKILGNASKLVKSGGHLIYSTCSLETDENEKVIERFLLMNEDFQKVSPKLKNSLLTGDKFGRTFPHRNQTDGFFIAELVRK
jgi:16S rRNA (cytosine967-C5)-methyltransferase